MMWAPCVIEAPCFTSLLGRELAAGMVSSWRVTPICRRMRGWMWKGGEENTLQPAPCDYWALFGAKCSCACLH